MELFFRATTRLLAALLLVAALHLVCLPAATADDFYTGTDVVVLTAANFKSKVLEDDHIWMIEFYAPWCGHCQKLKPDYIKAATASKGIVRFGAVNCDDHRSLASDYGIKGFPTLKLFGTNKKRYEDYNGARTAKAMADAALALLPNHVTVVTGKTHDDFLSKNEDLPKALLFTAKSSTTALYKALSLDLKGRMALGEVRSKKDSSLLKTYNVEESELPVLLVLPLPNEEKDTEEDRTEESGEKQPRYSGELKHKPLLKFLSKYAKPKPGKEKEGAGKSKSKSSESGSSEKTSASTPKGSAVSQFKSTGDVEAKCIKGKGFCVIALIKGSDEPATKAQVAKLEILEAKYQKDPIKFHWIDISTSPTLESVFLASDSHGAPEPPLVLLSPKKGKFTVHWGLEDAESLLDRAIGGDVVLDSQVEDGWHKALDSA